MSVSSKNGHPRTNCELLLITFELQCYIVVACSFRIVLIDARTVVHVIGDNIEITIVVEITICCTIRYCWLKETPAAGYISEREVNIILQYIVWKLIFIKLSNHIKCVDLFATLPCLFHLRSDLKLGEIIIRQITLESIGNKNILNTIVVEI